MSRSVICLRCPRVAFKMHRMRESLRKLLQIEDTAERTSLAFAIGVFLGFSPFLGLHTLTALAIAFFFKLNRVAILLGVWSNSPWWLVPYYTLATWLGMKMTGYALHWAALKEIFMHGKDQGFLGSAFWTRVGSQSGVLLSFLIGSSILAFLLALVAYPLCLRALRFYRSQRKKRDRARDA